jgi:hypothetical protein
MEVEYGLVTSSALPDKIRESDNFLEVDSSQWHDLVEYSQKLEPLKESEKVMVLVVAHGTPEQEEREKEKEKAEQEKIARLEQRELDEERETLIKQEMQEKENREKARLRARSREIMNALYGR